MIFLSLCSLFLGLAMPIPELVQCYHLFSSLVTELDHRSISSLLFWCVFFVGFGFVCSVPLGVVLLFAVF